MKASWIDRVTAPVAPVWTLKRQRARLAAELLQRHYDAASIGRRTQGWRRNVGDANAVIGPALVLMRDRARDLVRNNPYAESALSTITDHTVGWGIVGKPVNGDAATADAWKRWAESTDCDADDRHDFYGLQKLVQRTVVESGEVLVRRRIRLPQDGFEIPLQLQVLDPDFLDLTKDTLGFDTAAGGMTIQGVEYNAIGQRVAYWLYPRHPGARYGGLPTSQRVPAESVLHIFRPLRPGQTHGISWFAPVLLRFRDFDDFEDATLMKQKIAACLAVLLTDTDGSSPALGATDPAHPTEDYLEPGIIKAIGPGQDVQVVAPPPATDYDPYAKNVLRAIATGLGVTYEDLTGDYQNMPFSAARMSRLRHQARIHDWRYRLLIPQFCDRAWAWFAEVATVAGVIAKPDAGAAWTPPPLPSVDPDKESLASQRSIRNGLTTWSETIRESGQDPDDVAAELAKDLKRFDDLSLKLDCDPRYMTQAGQYQSDPKRQAEAAAAVIPPAPAEP